MNFSVTLAGMDAVSLGVGYLAKAALAGLKLGADGAAGLFVDEAKGLVPVKTGNLRDHIHFWTNVDTASQQQRTVTPVYDLEEGTGNKYGIDPPYARRIEFGFIGVDSLGRHYHQAANPFMRTAFENAQTPAEALIRADVLDALDEAMNQVAMRRH